MTQQKFSDLLNKHIEGTTSYDEKIELIDFFHSGDEPEMAKEVIAGAISNHNPETSMNSHDPVWQQTLMNIVAIDRSGIKKEIKKWNTGMYAAAAILIAVLGTISFFYLQHVSTHPEHSIYSDNKQTLPSPGKNELHLSDGSIISLDAATDGEIGRTGDVSFHKAGNKLRIDGDLAASDKSTFLLSTSNKSDYQLQFPDGSTSWLNGSSALRFSLPFEKNRDVELNGEAWFAIQPNARAGFKVHAAGKTIVVLGTSFNVKAYPAQSFQRISVESGRVKVMSGSNTLAELTRNQQSTISTDGIAEVRKADAASMAAWRKGKLVYQDELLKDIISDLEIYYDTRIRFESEKLMKTKTTLSLNKIENIEEVLQIICKTTGARLVTSQKGLFILR